ncbi:dihydrolipoamide acetyltransferase family protein [Desulfosporosinus metallidurans]|uniref:Dihydrolipoamide acetyltransferase component of pyruvate dehydrogenase complex n=1 Tax=Desulfosporosinus metallidurans TaxID=1888891 RepID=A0A1Q8QZI5_9FIRM|nr:dihydrolipoamide acetyltransferase family protein [Desulfosporosinus metallidurans]OLN32725.1 Dihydrolipoamide acetyltransferase component of pyruvate dehydrogenase complex [Desulfosporosinus metallidurans]
MATKVILPKQGLQMTEGTIIKWLFAEGQTVEAGQPLFEMETDKLTIEIEAPASGILLKIIRNVGEVVPITETIAVIGDLGEDISSILNTTGSKSDVADEQKNEVVVAQVSASPSPSPAPQRQPGERIFITPRAKMTVEEAGVNYQDISGTGPEGLIIEKDVKDYVESSKMGAKITPVAKKIAEQNQIDVANVDGTGARGKIMKADIEKAINERRTKQIAGEREQRLIPFAGMRKVIAENMMKSLHSMAQANHRMKVDMTEVMTLRERLKADGVKISFNDILVKVVAKALGDFPIANSTLTEEGIVLRDFVNVGIAVAVDNGLIVPVVKDADLMTLKEISTVSSELIEKAKSGKLGPDDYQGGTFTITNLGMFGIDEFTAVINSPEVGILAVGKIDMTPVVVGNEIVIKPIMVLSLTYDHRIVDGAPAAQFLQRIKQILQNPYLLL